MTEVLSFIQPIEPEENHIHDAETGLMIHEEVEIEDFTYDEEKQTFFYPCPCGDKFQISMDELFAGEKIAHCPSCSLLVKVIYDPADFIEEELEDDVVMC